MHTDFGDTDLVVGPYGERRILRWTARPGDECPVAEVPAGYSDSQEPNYFEDNSGRFIYARVCDVLGKDVLGTDVLGKHGEFSHP